MLQDRRNMVTWSYIISLYQLLKSQGRDLHPSYQLPDEIKNAVYATLSLRLFTPPEEDMG